MSSIEVCNRQRAMRLNRQRLVALARSVLAAEQVASAEISVAIVDDAEIHEINRRFLGHDYPTDVISFLLDSVRRPSRSNAAKKTTTRPRKTSAPRNEIRGAGKSLDGEIIISAESAARTAAELRCPPIHELSLYLVHGLLHLCGYDDLTAGERRTMRAREAEVLAPWKIVPRGAP
jgi:probable rRNA maturation factor